MTVSTSSCATARTLRLRPPDRRRRATRSSRFFAGLSDQSLYLRFHGHPAAVDGSSSRYLDPDWVERGALIGALADDGRRARRRARELRAAARPGGGRGRVRRRRRAARAAASARGCSSSWRGAPPQHGHRALRRRGAARQPARCSRVFADGGLRAVTRTLDGGVVEVRVPDRARPTATAQRVDERDHVAVAASLRPFFEPRTRRRARRLARGAARSAASSSATSSPATSPAPRTRSTAAASPLPACAATRRSTEIAGPDRPGRHLRSRRRSCSTRPRRRSHRACARSASSRPASPRSAPRAPSARSGCSRSCARTARG